MTDIYFHEPDSSTDPIDSLSQRLLVYLYYWEGAELGNLQNHIGAKSKKEIEVRVQEHLGERGAGLVTISKSTQQTLDGHSTEIQYIRLTQKGKSFVQQNLSNLAMPADFKQWAEKVRKIRERLDETRDSMHTMDADEISDSLARTSDELEELETRLSNCE